MKVAIIATGTELLKGTTVNTNLAFIGEQLTNIGLIPFRCLVTGDSRDDLLDALRETVNIAEVVITTGGLGPTSDDITRDVVGEFFGLKMHEDRQLMDELRQLWAKRGRGTPPAELFNQAMIPEHATILKNSVGTAPGLWIENEQSGAKKIIILLPGPPSELEPMFAAEVIPKLSMLAENTVFTESFMIAGTAELLVQKQVEPLTAGLPLELAYCASAEGVRVFFSSADRNLIR
ncbi:MAG: competence/damage-inducible protein A [Victivallaceae bacterium]